MSSPFFAGILGIAISSVLFSIYSHRPEFPILQIESDNFWRLDQPVKDDETIEPYKIDIDEERIKSFKQKIADEKKPKFNDPEFQSYFQNLTKVMLDFDWPQHQHFINTFKQYRTEIEGLKIHFLRISTPLKSKNQQLVPLLLIHGFPGSFWDYFKLIPILTNPSRHGFDFGVTESIQFDVILPSLPGFLFSDKPQREGLDGVAITRILSKLMNRLSIDSYFVHGCEGYGSDLATLLGSLYPERIQGIHLSNPFVRPTFSTFTLAKYSWDFFAKNQEIESGYTSIAEYFEDEKFRYPATPHIYGTAFQNSAIATALFIENRWKQFSTPTASTNLHKLFTYDEIATKIYLYFLTDTLPSSLAILDRSYNGDNLWLSAQLKMPTAISQSTSAPWKCRPETLAHKYFNITRISQISKGGLFHHLQDAQKCAEEIFSFVELQLL